MSRKVKSLYLIWAILFLSMGCSKESPTPDCDSDQDLFSIITQDSWQYTRLFVNGIMVLGHGDTLSGDLLEGARDCEVHSYWIFNANQTMSLEHGIDGCNAIDDFGEWTLSGNTFITHEKDENEFLVHTAQCVHEHEVTGIIHIDDTNLPNPRLDGGVEFTLTRR